MKPSKSNAHIWETDIINYYSRAWIVSHSFPEYYLFPLCRTIQYYLEIFPFQVLSIFNRLRIFSLSFPRATTSDNVGRNLEKS